MEFEIKEVNYDNNDFKNLCRKLDEFQNIIVPQRVKLGFTALDGLEKLQIILLAYDKNKVIACAALKPVNNVTAEVARVYTNEEYRGNGLAKILINKIIEFAKKHGYKKLVLDTWKDSTSARKLYERLGFVEIPMFDISTLKNSFCVEDEYKLKEIQKLLVFMEMVL